jgi:hypothetical protein
MTALVYSSVNPFPDIMARHGSKDRSRNRDEESARYIVIPTMCLLLFDHVLRKCCTFFCVHLFSWAAMTTLIHSGRPGGSVLRPIQVHSGSSKKKKRFHFLDYPSRVLGAISWLLVLTLGNVTTRARSDTPQKKRKS